MRAVVTGASGFLGRHLCALVDEVWPERVELTEPASIERAMAWGPEVVFHLAAMTDPRACEADPTRCEAVNVEGTRRVVEGAGGVPVVLCSTVHVYGPPRWLPLTEEHPLDPRGVYATSKARAERLAPKAIVARPFNLTGPGQGLGFAPADWALQARGEGPIRCGNLDVERDYLDVRDAAAGLVLLARLGRAGEAYNLCSGRAVTMRSIASALAQGRELVETVERRRVEVPRLVGSFEKAAALGWAPRIPLEQSLRDLAAYSEVSISSL